MNTTLKGRKPLATMVALASASLSATELFASVVNGEAPAETYVWDDVEMNIASTSALDDVYEPNSGELMSLMGEAEAGTLSFSSSASDTCELQVCSECGTFHAADGKILSCVSCASPLEEPSEEDVLSASGVLADSGDVEDTNRGFVATGSSYEDAVAKFKSLQAGDIENHHLVDGEFAMIANSSVEYSPFTGLDLEETDSVSVSSAHAESDVAHYMVCTSNCDNAHTISSEDDVIFCPSCNGTMVDPEVLKSLSEDDEDEDLDDLDDLDLDEDESDEDEDEDLDDLDLDDSEDESDDLESESSELEEEDLSGDGDFEYDSESSDDEEDLDDSEDESEDDEDDLDDSEDDDLDLDDEDDLDDSEDDDLDLDDEDESEDEDEDEDESEDEDEDEDESEDEDDLESESSVETDLLSALVLGSDVASKDVDLVNMNVQGENRWLALIKGQPAAFACESTTAHKENFASPKFKTMVEKAMDHQGVHDGLISLGFSGYDPELNLEVAIPKLLQRQAEDQICQAKEQFARERAEIVQRFEAALSIAMRMVDAGMVKDSRNQICESLTSSLTQAGVSNAGELVKREFERHSESLCKSYVAQAASLVALPEEVQNSYATALQKTSTSSAVYGLKSMDIDVEQPNDIESKSSSDDSDLVSFESRVKNIFK